VTTTRTQSDPAIAETKQLTGGMRVLLWIAGVLVFLAGVQLFVFSERTARYFAWTIDFPLTAAFLGAAYWASVAFETIAARQSVWAYARVAVPAVFVFTSLTLAATLLHLDLFHLGSEFEAVTRAVTWFWIGIYIVVPIMMIVLAVRQSRAPGVDPPRSSPLPRWITAALWVHAVIMLSLGGALFIAPERAVTLWPWPLTPLTGRAIGAWVFSLGLAAAHSLWENDTRRVRPAAVGYIVLAVLQGIAALRFLDDVDWGRLEAVLYVVFLISMVVVGAAALRRRPVLTPAT
jgi:uncharacterized integral membrane protein